MYEKRGRMHDFCFFISYNYKDIKDAEELANHIMFDFGYNVYLDLYDDGLDTTNCEHLVGRIQEGIKYSTHLIGVVTQNSKKSWWVPYEIGFAQANNVETCSIRDNSIAEIPDYLTISKEMKFENISSLDVFLNKININRRHSKLFSKEINHDMINKKYHYFDK